MIRILSIETTTNNCSVALFENDHLLILEEEASKKYSHAENLNVFIQKVIARSQIKFKENLLKEIDVVFSALPNGQAQKISNKLTKRNVLIDLSADFRLKDPNLYSKYYKIKHSAVNNIKKSIYALPEIKNKKIKNYNIIGCPGCYPTSILLPLIPLIKRNLISKKNIVGG